MKITFISQASIVVETIDATIWTDPWLFGTAFNNSWRLFPEPKFDEIMYNTISHLWISHEHPDHFHFPTLKSLPQEFKDKVILLFQENNSNKMPSAFKMLGFKNIQLLKNRRITNITKNTKIHISQIGQMDSSLAVMSEGKVILNLNDCEINSRDAKSYKKDLGKIDLVLNQFSMAGFNGKIDYEKNLPRIAEQILQTMVDNHRDLDVDVTIPIASYIYFCMEDNSFMNEFSNTPRDLYEKFKLENLRCRFLNVNETYNMDGICDEGEEEAFLRMQATFESRSSIVYEPIITVSMSEIRTVFFERHNQLKLKYPKCILKKLSALTINIPDIGKALTMSLYTGQFEISNIKSSDDFDIQINSQPLFFALKFPFGFQTLGVSARFLVNARYDVWKWYRIISSMNNAEVYLKPKYLFSKNNIMYFMSRYDGLFNQMRYQLSRMK